MDGGGAHREISRWRGESGRGGGGHYEVENGVS